MVRTPLIAAAVVTGLSAFASPAAADGLAQLPDLDQVAPADLRVKQVVTRRGRMFRLGFASATENRGRGPLTLHGFRRGRDLGRMQVDQLVSRSDGSSRLIRKVGGMEYVVHPDHRHWHLIGFARYELRPTGGRSVFVLRDRKTGFCLGDRYTARRAKGLPGFQPFPAQGDTCGLGKPGLVGLFAGISVGYGDAYAAHLEGQYVDITGVPAGRYELVHTANPDRRLLESSYRNNSSSVLISLRWPNGYVNRPALSVLNTCPASGECSRTEKQSTHTTSQPSRRAHAH